MNFVSECSGIAHGCKVYVLEVFFSRCSQHEISNDVVCATSKASDQTARMHLCKLLKYSMTVKLLTEHNLEFLSLTGGCTGSSESTLVKIPHCLISHAKAHMSLNRCCQICPSVECGDCIWPLLTTNNI